MCDLFSRRSDHTNAVSGQWLFEQATRYNADRTLMTACMTRSTYDFLLGYPAIRKDQPRWWKIVYLAIFAYIFKRTFSSIRRTINDLYKNALLTLGTGANSRDLPRKLNICWPLSSSNASPTPKILKCNVRFVIFFATQFFMTQVNIKNYKKELTKGPPTFEMPFVDGNATWIWPTRLE